MSVSGSTLIQASTYRTPNVLTLCLCPTVIVIALIRLSIVVGPTDHQQPSVAASRRGPIIFESGLEQPVMHQLERHTRVGSVERKDVRVRAAHTQQEKRRQEDHGDAKASALATWSEPADARGRRFWDAPSQLRAARCRVRHYRRPGMLSVGGCSVSWMGFARPFGLPTDMFVLALGQRMGPDIWNMCDVSNTVHICDDPREPAHEAAHLPARTDMIDCLRFALETLRVWASLDTTETRENDHGSEMVLLRDGQHGVEGACGIGQHSNSMTSWQMTKSNG